MLFVLWLSKEFAISETSVFGLGRDEKDKQTKEKDKQTRRLLTYEGSYHPSILRTTGYGDRLVCTTVPRATRLHRESH